MSRVQTLDFDDMSSDDLAIERANFEKPWNFWNVFGGVVAWIVSMYLLSLVLRVEPGGMESDKNKKEALLASAAGPNYLSTAASTNEVV
jgi:hypothetical protein